MVCGPVKLMSLVAWVEAALQVATVSFTQTRNVVRFTPMSAFSSRAPAELTPEPQPPVA
jgi:hypothetical protein